MNRPHLLRGSGLLRTHARPATGRGQGDPARTGRGSVVPPAVPSRGRRCSYRPRPLHRPAGRHRPGSRPAVAGHRIHRQSHPLASRCRARSVAGGQRPATRSRRRVAEALLAIHAADAAQLTHTGTRVGTPGFAAPELILGNRVSTAADVFALGALHAYATTGRMPFGEGNPDAVLYRLVHLLANLDGSGSGARDRGDLPGQGPLAATEGPRDPAELPTHESGAEREHVLAAATDRRRDRLACRRGAPRTPSAAAAKAANRSARGGRSDRGCCRVPGGLPAGPCQWQPAAATRNRAADRELSDQGQIDWVHWVYLDTDERHSERFVEQPVSLDCRYNLHCSNRKSGARRIGDYTPIGNAAPFRLRDAQSPVAFSWRDGEPTLAAHDMCTLEYMGASWQRVPAHGSRRPNSAYVHALCQRIPRQSEVLRHAQRWQRGTHCRQFLRHVRHVQRGAFLGLHIHLSSCDRRAGADRRTDS
jgi:hypothetical protein